MRRGSSSAEYEMAARGVRLFVEEKHMQGLPQWGPQLRPSSDTHEGREFLEVR